MQFSGLCPQASASLSDTRNQQRDEYDHFTLPCKITFQSLWPFSRLSDCPACWRHFFALLDISYRATSSGWAFERGLLALATRMHTVAHWTSNAMFSAGQGLRTARNALILIQNECTGKFTTAWSLGGTTGSLCADLCEIPGRTAITRQIIKDTPTEDNMRASIPVLFVARVSSMWSPSSERSARCVICKQVELHTFKEKFTEI